MVEIVVAETAVVNIVLDLASHLAACLSFAFRSRNCSRLRFVLRSCPCSYSCLVQIGEFLLPSLMMLRLRRLLLPLRLRFSQLSDI